MNEAPQDLGVGGEPASMDAEIATLTDSMFLPSGERNPEYWHSEHASGRLSQLLAARQRGEEPPEAAPVAFAPVEVRETSEPAMHSYALGDLAGEPVVEDFAAVLGAAELPREVVDAMFSELDDATDYSASDASDRDATAAELRVVWGDEYGSKVAAIRRYLTNNLPPGVDRMLLGARVGGRALLNNTELMAELGAIAERSPRMPAPTGDRERDIAAIEKVMGTDPAGYRRDVGLQLRLRSLYGARGREAST